MSGFDGRYPKLSDFCANFPRAPTLRHGGERRHPPSEAYSLDSDFSENDGRRIEELQSLNPGVHIGYSGQTDKNSSSADSSHRKKAQELLEDFTEGLTDMALAHRTRRRSRRWKIPIPVRQHTKRFRPLRPQRGSFGGTAMSILLLMHPSSVIESVVQGSRPLD